MQDIESHLDLWEAFVQVDGRAVGMEASSCRDDVIFARPDRAIAALTVDADRVPLCWLGVRMAWRGLI